MNFLWLIALAQAAYVASILLAGRIVIRGQLLADRDSDPNKFWFCVTAFAVSVAVVVYEAINPPY